MMVAVALMTALSAEAQTSLVGREYHNPNIMSDIYKDIDRQVADMKAKALVKIEIQTQGHEKRCEHVDDCDFQKR